MVLLSRSSNTGHKIGRSVYWDANSIGKWSLELEGAQVLLNLTGRSIDCRHNAANREEILNSRVHSTRVLGEAVSIAQSPPPCWLNASSMALYGQLWGNASPHTEQSSLQSGGFLEDVTVVGGRIPQMEERRSSAGRFENKFRFGKNEGAFPLLKKLCSFGLGGAQGTGEQWVSWLHENDWVRVVRFLIENEKMHGALNLASPNPVINKEFMKILRSESTPLGLGFPAPSLGVKLGCFLLGSAPDLALQSRKVVSDKLKDSSYEFPAFPDLLLQPFQN